MSLSVSDLEGMCEAVLESETEALRCVKQYTGKEGEDWRVMYQTRATRLRAAHELLVNILVRRREKSNEKRD